MLEAPGWLALFLPGELVRLLVGTGEVQPAGVDLRVDSVCRPRGVLRLGVDSRSLPGCEPVEPTGGWWRLGGGAYRVRFRGTIRVPEGFVGFCYPRSTLLRSGVLLACAVWDPGFEGTGEALLWVPSGVVFELEVGAAIAQLVLARVEPKPSRVYSGVYSMRYQAYTKRSR